MQVIETHLFIKFNSHSFDYENKILYQPKFQALTFHFNIRY